MPSKTKAELVAENAALRERLTAIEAKRSEGLPRPEIEWWSRLIAESRHDLVCLHDLEARYLAVSPAVRPILGYAPDELLGRSPADFFHPDDVPVVLEPSRWKEQDGKTTDLVEFRVRAKDGGFRWLQSHVRPILDPQGRLIHYLTISQDITSRKNAEVALRARTQQLQILNDLTQGLAALLDTQRVAREILSATQVLFPGVAGRLWEQVEGGETLRLIGSIGLLDPEGGRRVRFRHGEGLAGIVAVTLEPMQCPDIASDPHFINKEWARAEGLTSVIVVPLIRGKSYLGNLAIFTHEPHTFSPDEVALLQSFAAHAAIAIENARLFGDVEGRRREAEVFADLTRNLNTSLDVDSVLHQVADAARTLCRCDLASIALQDALSEGVRLQYRSGLRREDMVGHRISSGQGIGGQVLATGLPFRTANYAEDPRISKDFLHVTLAEGIIAELAVPIRIENTVEGILFASNRTPRPFTDHDEFTLQRLADHAAIAIRNARLFSATQREIDERTQAEADARQSRQMLQAVLDTIPQRVFWKDRNLQFLGCNRAYARDANLDDPAAILGRDDFAFNRKEDAESFRAGDRKVIETGSPKIGYEESKTRPDGTTMWVLTSKVPILDAQEQVVGVLGTYEDITERKQAEEALLERTRQLEALRSLGEEITRELDLVRLLGLVTRRATELVAGTSGGIYLWDEQAQQLMPHTYYGPGAERMRFPRRPGEGLTGRVVQERRGAIINDYRSSPYAHPRTLQSTGITAALAEPLLYRDRLLGVIAVHHEIEGRTFTESDQKILQLFAPQAAIAIENARLHEATSRRAHQLSTLIEMTQTLTTELDPHVVSQRILAAAQTLIPGCVGRLWERLETDRTFRVIGSLGLQQPEGGQAFQLVPNEGLIGIAEATRQPVISANVTRDPRFKDPDWAVAEGLVGSIILPLIHEEEIIGFLTIYTRAPHDFISEEVDLLRAFSAQAAIAIRNARLYAAAQRELSERTRAETALQEKTEELDRFFTMALDLLCIADTDGYFRRVNPAWASVLGYDIHELEGKRLLDFVHPDDLQETLAAVERLAAQQEVLNFVNRYRCKDGSYRWIEWRACPYQGTLIYAAARDITERRQAEEERRRIENRMQHAQKLESLGVLAGGIAHDFNNLLVAILGHTELALLQLAPGAPVHGHLQEIETASHRAADLCKHMLAFSGKGHFVVEALDLSVIVREMAQMLTVAISKKAIVQYNLAPDLPAIQADATQLRQVVMNLITNASEAIGDQPGVIRVATGTTRCDRAYLQELALAEGLAEGLYVYLEVSDTGCGMDEATRARIFDPFFSTKFTGRGLGLAAVLGIVRGHKGAIKVYSEVGRGTIFNLLFPAIAEPAGRARLAAAEDQWQGQGVVLLVDDEAGVRETGQQLLEWLGFTVLTAADGRQALDVFQARAHDIVCVLLDLTMPRMDGEETFRELRRLRTDARVVLSSGYNQQDVTQRFAGKRLAGFIQKPYRLEDLRRTLRAALEGGGDLPAGPGTGPDAAPVP
jgi:PAS domain S-box-containing protein